MDLRKQCRANLRHHRPGPPKWNAIVSWENTRPSSVGASCIRAQSRGSYIKGRCAQSRRSHAPGTAGEFAQIANSQRFVRAQIIRIAEMNTNRRAEIIAWSVMLLLLLCGCSGNHSALNPGGIQSEKIS